MFFILKKHRKLAEKRSENYNQSKAAKVAMWLGSAFFILYLIFFAIVLSSIANDSRQITSVEFIFGLSPIILLIDFLMRFVFQQTPAQLVKPYVLLPIPRYTCINSFIFSSLFKSINYIWYALLIPYIIMSVLFSYNIFISLGILFVFWLLISINSQWYSIVRTLLNDSMLWLLLPIGVYGLIAMPWYMGSSPDTDRFFNFYSSIGDFIADGQIWIYPVAIALLFLLLLINQRVQYSHVMVELARVEKTKLRHVSQFSFLDRFGEIGSYMKLELKMIMRNKNPRKTFYATTAMIVVFSSLIAFTKVYDDAGTGLFLCYYNFGVYGFMMLVTIMAYEGNYIDCLMTHKENILSLLKAKYIFYCLLLVLPFLLMTPVLFVGKWSFLMLLSLGVFTAGFQYFVLLQMAVYNKQTIPLNTKFTNNNNLNNKTIQIVMLSIVLVLPTFIIGFFQIFLSRTTAFFIMLVIGILFILTSNVWLRNIYNRMMKKKYELLESYQASR